jgi:hypothetical protein
MGFLRMAWRETSSTVRILCLAMWLLGIAATVAGAWGDATGWWDNKNFMSNLASSATGALFGLPLALVFVQHITNRQASERERREAWANAAQLARDVAADVRQLVRMDVDPQAPATLLAALREARSALRAPAGEVDLAVLGRAYSAWTRLVASHTATAQVLDRLSGNWRALTDDARPRLLQLGFPWLDRQLAGLLDETLAGVMSPETDLFWMGEMRQAGTDLSTARRLGPREVDTHVKRLSAAEEYLRGVVRAGRYVDEVRHHFA